MKKLLLPLLVLMVMSACNRTEYVHVGPNWAAMNELDKAKSEFNVKVESLSSEYKLGDKFKFKVSSAEDGYLWVVQVDSNDDLSVLFPNSLASDNKLKANVPVAIPGLDSGFSLEVAEPIGSTVLLFAVSTQDVEDLSEFLETEKDIAKAIEVVKEESAMGFSKTVFKIVE